MAGGPEGVALLPPGSPPVVMASDDDSVRALGPLTHEVLTDTLQRREANFAAVRQNYGPVLGADQQYTAPREAHDWLPAWIPSDSTLASEQTVKQRRGRGGSAGDKLPSPIRPSARRGTSRGYPRAPSTGAPTRCGRGPGFSPVGQSLSVTWAEPVTIPATLGALFDMADGADVGSVTIVTDQGSAHTPITSPTVSGGDASRYLVAASPSPRARAATYNRRSLQPVRANPPCDCATSARACYRAWRTG